jgi:hypothetical protein
MKKLIATVIAAVALVALTGAAADADTQWGKHAAHHHVAKDTQWG